MSNLKKIKIPFPNNWIDVSNENPNGAPTFIKENIEEPGVLQITYTEYISGEIPNPSYADLINLSKSIGNKNEEFGNCINENYQECNFGKFGYVEFNSTVFPFSSIWNISDSKSFIFATYICSTIQSDKEIIEVYNILKGIRHEIWIFLDKT